MMNAINPELLASYRRRIEDELRSNILPFWMERTLDRENGGYFGALTNDLVVDNDVPRSAVVAARILWTFSAAYHAFREPAALAAARHACAYLTGPLWDEQHGGVYWQVDRRGNPVDDRKHIYAQAFAIYGLSEYFRATGDPQVRSLAHNLFHQVEDHSFDPVNGGNIDCFNREWGELQDMRLSSHEPHCRKSMNTLLHLMEAYTNLLRAWPDPVVKEKQAGLIVNFLERVIDPHTGHFHLFFDDAWHSLASTVSFGHDIEGAWLLEEAAGVQGDHNLLARARKAALVLASAVLDGGRDEDGSVFYEGDFTKPESQDKHWWGQSEGMVGFYASYQLSKREEFARAALQCWDVIDAHFIDRDHGDWFKVLDRAGNPLPRQLKVGPWECPYHHARACLEMMHRLDATLAAN
jgi:mannobiose 2-epimerase